METSDRPATIEDYAALNWEPWKYEEDKREPPSNEELTKLAGLHLISAHIAWAMAHQSKPELIETFRVMSSTDGHEVILGNMQLASDFFGGLHKLIDVGMIRYMSAGAVVVESSANDAGG